MAINPVQLVGQTRQMPDFVGDFIRGRQFKQQQDYQNRVLGMQEQQYQDQQQAAEAQRQAQLENVSTQYFGRAADVLANTPPEQRPQVWAIIRAQAQANMRPQDIEGMPEQYTPGLETQMQRQAQLKGYTSQTETTQNVGKVDPSQYTPESVAQFQRTGDYSTLQFRDKGPDMTSSQQDWQEYQRLLQTDPEQAQVFGRKAGFVSREGQDLSSYMEKRLGAANDESVMSAAAARNYQGLAQDFANADVAGGARGKWSERLKQLTGSEDAISRMRQEYRQIRNTEAVKNLPPGVASDKDIELALSGFPSDTANPQYIASFMRGMSKLADQRAKYNEFKAQFISDNGTERGFLDAWKAQADQGPAAQERAPSSAQGGVKFLGFE